MKRAEIINKLYNEGFTHETLSSLGDRQVYALAKRVVTEASIGAYEVESGHQTIRLEKCQSAFNACQMAVTSRKKEISKNMSASAKQNQQVQEAITDDMGDDGTKTIDTDNIGNPDVDIKKGNGSKKDVKLITDKNGVEGVDEDMVEEWMTRVVTKNTQNEAKDLPGHNPDYFYDEDSIISQMNRQEKQKEKRTKLFDSIEQEYAFEQLNKYVLDLDGYEIMVDELETGEDPEESVLNLFLSSNSGMVWDISIYTDGNIYMDDAPIQDSQDLEEEIREKERGEGNDKPDNWMELPGYNPEYFYDEDSILGKEEELAETERDVVGAYMGAPVGTEMPVTKPRIKPTTTPARPGKKRGPFERPKTTPKPKAGNDEMPDWFGFDDIKSEIENS